ncbi:MAG: hypothetical protein ACTHWO_06650 [Nesterenkonia sp.]
MSHDDAAPHHAAQHDDAETSSRSFDILRDPWVQGALTGALALIPARKYPGWLRRGIIWAPTVVGALGLGFLAANPDAQRRFAVAVGAGQQNDQEPEENPEGNAAQQADAPTILKVAAAGAAGGGVASAAIAVSFWADEKLERGLRRVGVPFPRAVLAALSGAATGWMVTQENARESTQQSRQCRRG